ncbi:MAG TPA: SRPBCC domain-containing protein [Ignavibacteriaceae bacterium]|nr:SRPBCC domain-containing protein [Ignavibacteriaceae bacterium]
MVKRISDDSVKKSTGKAWKDWFAILNKAGAKKMEHKDIATYLYEECGLEGWWAQMVTVQYEQEIKGRKKHERPEGYEISKSKTFSIPISKIFKAVLNQEQREKWLKDHTIKISKSTLNKSIRGKWVDGKTNIEFQFYPKDKSKTQLVVQHHKLQSSKDAEKMKKYWEKNFNNLKKFLD